MFPDISSEETYVYWLNNSFDWSHFLKMAIAAILGIGFLFHAYCVEKSIAVDAIEGVVIFGDDFSFVGTETLGFTGEIFTLLIDFIIAIFDYIHRLILLVIWRSFYNIEVELRFGFVQLISFFWQSAHELSFGVGT